MARRGSGARADRFRPEIQALRAFAVGLVVVFHLWPRGPIQGGFIGVDVFFVISGFLITGHLVRDLGTPTGAYLAGFWKRRAIRILPASLVMLALVGLIGALALPPLQQRRHWIELLASTLYVENLQLIRSASDYLTALDSPSAFQHAWSLSVEEQFYLLWPLLILALFALARRFVAPPHRRTVLAAGLVIVILASAAWSAIDTVLNPSRAYFSTFTRMHEFALGGLLAVLGSRHTLSVRSGRIVRWLGVLLIALSAVVLRSGGMPGLLAAVPCVGAAAVIRAGSAGTERSKDRCRCSCGAARCSGSGMRATRFTCGTGRCSSSCRISGSPIPVRLCRCSSFSRRCSLPPGRGISSSCRVNRHSGTVGPPWSASLPRRR